VLADATEALGGSLDDRQSVAEVARLALRTLGDACVVDLDAEGGLQEIAVAHIDPTREAAVRELHRHPATVDGSHPLAVVRRTRQPLLVPAVDGVPPLGVRSAMFVPLTVRDHFLGVLSYYNAGPRRFDEDDLALATELGRRVALAVDNARLYREAERASAARDVVLALVSHDLRNPLSTIGMCATSLLDPAPISDDEMRSIADTINRSVDWTQRIIRDLLDVTSIEAGRLALERSPVLVADVLASVREVMLVQTQAAGVELASDGAGGAATIDADHDRLLQVLLNLLGNAVKHTPPGGRITVRAVPEPAGGAPAAFVRFSVRDTGRGIAPDDLPHVFDRYWQMDRAGRAGAGLGLAIAKGIVEAHGGTIEVTSAVGLGSTFSFTIPAAAAPAPTPVRPAAAVPAPGAEPGGGAG
jgi:signal transduction histidine kinase